MATVIAPPASPSVPERIVLDDISWEQYVKISDALTPQRGLRLTYDGQRLELMTLSFPHEHYRRMIGRLIDALSFELRIDLQGGGSMTFRREDLERGLEPDECYWIAHAAEMLEVTLWDPEIHPSPDLAVEVDIFASSLDRQEIYGKLQVPELWRFDGELLQAFRLAESGQYVPVEMSLAFPFLRVSDLAAYLVPDQPLSETETIRRFVEWLREQGFRRA
jgi:Uma2 family endonuclease